MQLEKLIRLTTATLVALFAASVFTLGATEALKGTTIYMETAQGKTPQDALTYAAMVVGISLLATFAAAINKDRAAKYTTLAVALVMACTTIYMINEGKLTNTAATLEKQRQQTPEYKNLQNEISEYSENITQLNATIIKLTNADQTQPTVMTCATGSKNYTSCNATRTKQLQQLTEAAKTAGEPLRQAKTALQDAQNAKKLAESKLSSYNSETNRQIQAKNAEMTAQAAISSATPEIASLFGSFILALALKSIYLIALEKHPVQQTVQASVHRRTLPHTAVHGAQTQPDSFITDQQRDEKTSEIPSVAEQQLRQAIDNQTANLSIRKIKENYPAIARDRIPQILHDKWRENKLDRNKNATGKTTYTYPINQTGGQTTTAAATNARLTLIQGGIT